MRRLTEATSANIAAAPNHAAPAVPNVVSRGEAVNPSNGAPRMNNATPRLAPELTPKTYGPASGLRNRVCICRPLTDNAAPAKMATKAFMRRMSIMILAVTASHSPPVSVAHISLKGILTEPTAMSAANSSMTSAESVQNSIVERLRIILFKSLVVV